MNLWGYKYIYIHIFMYVYTYMYLDVRSVSQERSQYDISAAVNKIVHTNGGIYMSMYIRVFIIHMNLYLCISYICLYVYIFIYVYIYKYEISAAVNKMMIQMEV
jgi:hypothetical protein